MSHRRRYYLLAVLLLTLYSCGDMLNKRVTLWRSDKIPYGTWYAFNELHHLFNKPEVITSDVSPVTFYDESDSNSALIIITRSVKPDLKELNALLSYAARGNHVFISALSFSQSLLDSFHVKTNERGNPGNSSDSMSIQVRPPASQQFSTFSYPGYALDDFFTNMDTNVTNVLGKDMENHANYVQFRYANGGTVSLHLAPTAFTNFFLLHKHNKEYFDHTLSFLPPSVEKIRWDDYFRHHTDGTDNAERSGFSKLGAFLDHPVLRWAFWLTIILFALIYLFESKRKQRLVPVVSPLRNSSLDFVETIGRLYYQRKDNGNLAAKMSAHFLGQVRSAYNLPTSSIDDEFEERLAFKTGMPLEKIKQLTGFVRLSESGSAISDEALLTFSKQTDEFYKKT